MRFVVLCMLFIQFLSAYSIVFVHIGSSLPEYLTVAIKQAQLFNPEAVIYLICNDKARKKFKIDRVQCVSCETLLKTKKHQEFLRSSTFNRNEPGGFWLVTSERFFYLEELIKGLQLKDVFHLENDVMLYVDLSTLLPIFHKKYAHCIGATFDCDTRCIPGFVYFPDLTPLSQLTVLMADQANKGKNDMEMVQAFKAIYHGQYIEHLPIVPCSYSNYFSLGNQIGGVPKQADFYSLNYLEFESIFDAAAIGQYLGGISPLNGSGKIGFINETCYFNPSYFRYVWEQDSKGRRVPYCVLNDEKIRINNLHIHSKNLEQFFSGKAL